VHGLTSTVIQRRCWSCSTPRGLLLKDSTASSCLQTQDKHLGLWELTPRPPPRMAKTQTLHTVPHIDYSDSQVPPSDSGPYPLTLM